MRATGVEAQPDPLAAFREALAVQDRHQLLIAGDLRMHDRFRPERLGERHLGFDALRAVTGDDDVMRPNAQRGVIARLQGGAVAGERRGKAARAFHDDLARLCRAHLRRQQVHARRADEAGDEQVGRLVVKLERAADLLDTAGAHDHDAVGQRHRLDLVVRDIDHRRRQALVQRRDLRPRADAQLGVEIGQRLVEQERGRVAHDGTADGDALLLAAGELPRPAVEIGRDLQHARRLGDPLLDLRLRHADVFKPEGEVLAHASCADRARRTGTPSPARAGRPRRA